MKILITFVGFISLISLDAFAFQEGKYNCESPKAKISVEYKISTITQSEINLPYVEIATTYSGELGAEDRTFLLKGIANELVDSSGKEFLILEKTSIALKPDGSPVCAK